MTITVLTFVQVVPLILQAYDTPPLQNYRTGLRKTIDNSVEEQITQKHITPAQPTGQGQRKKDSRNMSREVALATRLAMLTSTGIHGVAGDVFAILHRITKEEKFKAIKDKVKAAAQGRILLPSAGDTAVQMLVEWIYRGTLYCHDGRQLYALFDLARDLGIEALSELCLSKIANGASDILHAALEKGIHLRDLLVHESGSAHSILEVVFGNVLTGKNPPTRLLEFVIKALAENMDLDLWLHLKDITGHEIALQLVEAMVKQREFKTEQSSSVTVKSERPTTITELPTGLADGTC